MKTLVALLTLSLFHLCVADVEPLEDQALEFNTSKNSNTVSAAADMTKSQQINHQFFIILRKLEAKLRSTEAQLETLRREIQGKNILNKLHFRLIEAFKNNIKITFSCCLSR